MKQICGCFDPSSGELMSSSIGVTEHEDATFRVEIFGHAVLDGKDNDGAAIATAFAVHDKDITKELSGLYIVLIYNKFTRQFTVLQDRATSPIAFYYTVYEDKLFYGTSLKTVLWQSARPTKLNEMALEEFLLNGYIYGEQTLADGILKLKAFHMLTASSDGVAQVSAAYHVPAMTKGEALDAFRDTLDRAILAAANGEEEEVSAPLSSGYDSSYIAHVLHEQTDKAIRAFSIGGKFGKNELPQVKENAAKYERMSLRTALTDENTLQNLPDIVWRLEGNVYENGVFLQYELAKLVSSELVSTLICGECADQVFNTHYFEQDRLHPDGGAQYYEFAEYPFIFGHYLILKKSGILFNSFDVETRYPYLNDGVVAVAQPLGAVCGTDKRVHTANCGEVLPASVLRNIMKIGGATEVHSLFKDKAAMNRFIKTVEESEFYRTHEAVIARTNRLEAPQTGVAKVKTAVRNTALSALHIGKEGRAKDAYFHEEMKLRQYFYYVYVMLFEKLILSGEYASRLSSDGIDVKLDELLK